MVSAELAFRYTTQNMSMIKDSCFLLVVAFEGASAPQSMVALACVLLRSATRSPHSNDVLVEASTRCS